MYEVIRTATVIHFNSTLIDRAASNISRFLVSTNNDWKYCGEWGGVGLLGGAGLVLRGGAVEWGIVCGMCCFVTLCDVV